MSRSIPDSRRAEPQRSGRDAARAIRRRTLPESQRQLLILRPRMNRLRDSLLPLAAMLHLNQLRADRGRVPLEPILATVHAEWPKTTLPRHDSQEAPTKRAEV